MNRYEKYYSTDIIAHYTRLESAIGILKSNRLRLSPRSMAYDCLERLFGFDARYVGSQVRENYYYADSLEVQQVQEHISEFYKGIKQVCFCKTVRTNQFVKSLDDLSFMHMRMWEQYADCYKGVCLLFSRDKLLQANPDCISADMKYELLSRLTCGRLDEGIDIDQLKEIGKDSYITIQEQQILKLAFNKSSDYREENEFRIMKTRCKSDAEDYLDINNSLIAVVYFPGYSGERMCEEKSKDKPCHFKECKSFVLKQLEFLKHCKENEIEILRVAAENGRIDFETEEEFSQHCASMRELFSRMKSESE